MPARATACTLSLTAVPLTLAPVMFRSPTSCCRTRKENHGDDPRRPPHPPFASSCGCRASAVGADAGGPAGQLDGRARDQAVGEAVPPAADHGAGAAPCPPAPRPRSLRLGLVGGAG